MLRAFFRQSAGSLYHIVIVAMSAGVALLLPIGAARFLSFWSHVEQDQVSLIAIEMSVAVLLMAGINFVHRSPRDRALADAAWGAGLVSFFPRRGPEVHQRIQALKEEQGTGRSVLVIGSSGAGNLLDHVGDLSSVLDRCLEAKILLVNPFHGDVRARMEALGHPDNSYPQFRADFAEYDVETEELVCRSRTGQEIRREPVEIGPAPFIHHAVEHPRVDADDPFQLLHAPGPYLPVRGYEID